MSTSNGLSHSLALFSKVRSGSSIGRLPFVYPKSSSSGNYSLHTTLSVTTTFLPLLWSLSPAPCPFRQEGPGFFVLNSSAATAGAAMPLIQTTLSPSLAPPFCQFPSFFLPGTAVFLGFLCRSIGSGLPACAAAKALSASDWS